MRRDLTDKLAVAKQQVQRCEATLCKGVARIGNSLRQKNLWASFGTGSLPSTSLGSAAAC